MFSYLGGSSIEMTEKKFKDAAEKQESSSNANASSLSASHKMRPTDGYMKLVAKERPIAIFMTVFFFAVAPLVFRYALYSSVQDGMPETKYYIPGNGTMEMYTDWECHSCAETEGVTLNSLQVTVKNVTNPNTEGGFPSVAIFASQDLKTWYNFFNPGSEVQLAYISNWDHSMIYVNDTSESAACLGGVYNNYLVACLNIQNLAFAAKKGDVIRGPPFNDRCFQLETMCGVPCVQLDGGQYPPQCDKGSIDRDMLIGNTTTEGTTYKEPKGWGQGLSTVDWLILITIFLDTIGNFLRFLPVLSGLPTEVESAKSVQVSGTAALANGTPIVTENEAIFLRGLVGRTLTVLHTIGSRHNIKGFYVDMIINEKRTDGDDKRMEMWAAWMQFIDLLANIKTKHMSWEHNLHSEEDDMDNIDSSEGTKPTSSHLITDSSKFTSTAGACVLRSVRIKRDQTVEFDCGLAAVLFKGVSMLSDSSYEYEIDDDNMSTDSFDDDQPLLQTQSLDIRSTRPNTKKQEQLFQTPSQVHVRMEDVLPLISFLNGWLEEIKHNDAVYNYKDKTEALKSIFNDAPAAKYFDGDNLVEVQDRLLLLFSIFNGDKSQLILEEEGFLGRTERRYNRYIHRDDRAELLWTITRPQLPDWQVAWSYWSRSKVKKMHEDDEVTDDYLYESTRIKKSAVVFLKNPPGVSPINAFDHWIVSRANTYKVLNVRKEHGTKWVDLIQWPPQRTYDVEKQPMKSEAAIITRMFDEVTLIEKNRGKAGALNVMLDYIRLRSAKWAVLNNVPQSVQKLVGIVDARHMLSEPAIFWNEGLPHFARNQKGQGTVKRMAPILVQYPQFFSNVIRDDFLDNKNSGYYTIWQTLRDCAKVCTSSGTNAIWDITDTNFIYATTSRIEDTGTTQQVFHKYLTVHLPCFVAYGIAKDTEDYIEAVYRWSTGAVELFWATLFSHQIYHYFIILGIVILFTFASFAPYANSYFIWLVTLFFMGVMAYFEKSNGYRPLRQLNVSATIVMNGLYWISNLSSIMWVAVVPIRIAIFSVAPLSKSLEQSLFWAFISLSVRLPIGIITDRIIAIARFLSPKTIADEWNYNLVLWRSSQLYLCSFAYTLLSVLSGTRTAFRAWWMDGDNTMWSSYRISNDEMKRAREDMRKEYSIFSCRYQFALYIFCRLHFLKAINAVRMPDIITKYLAAVLLILQVVCIAVSVNFTNKTNASYLLTTLIVCSLNVFLVVDIALLLMPSLTGFLGRPMRLEYVFAILSAIVIISLAVSHNLESVMYYVNVI